MTVYKYRKIRGALRKGDFPPVDYNKLFAIWGLQVKKFEHVRAVLKVETEDGTFAIKYFKHDLIHLKYIIQAMNYLMGNGFENIISVVPTIKGEDFYQDENGLIFFLMPWINGRESNLYDKKELYQASKLMAEFHKASLKFKPKSKEIPNAWGKWPEEYQKTIDNFQKLKDELLSKTSKDDIDNIILHYWDDYYTLNKQALDELKNSRYAYYVKQAKKTCCLCHYDFTYHNILITPDNKYYLIDLDYLRCDSRILDLSRFLIKELAHFDYNFEICELILKGYNEVYPLEKDEYKLLWSRILYPHKFMELVLDHYFKNKERPSKVVLHRLRKIIKGRQNFLSFLKRFENKYLS